MGGCQGPLVEDIRGQTLLQSSLENTVCCHWQLLSFLIFGLLSRRRVVIANTLIWVDTSTSFGTGPGMC